MFYALYMGETLDESVSSEITFQDQVKKVYEYGVKGSLPITSGTSQPMISGPVYG